MACPAFAEVINGNTVNSPNCSQPTLNGTSGTSKFTAQWTPIWHTITLNEDDYNATTNASGIGVTTSNIGNDSGNLTTANTLYYEEGDALVYKGYAGTLNGTNMVLENPVSPTGRVLTTLPDGKNVTYTITNVNPSANVTGSPTFPGITAATREFDGFWSSVSGANADQYITEGGYLTQQGATAASNGTTNLTWYARYACATPTFTNVTGTQSTTPVWAGYTFKGYGTSNTDPGTGNYVTPGCINADTTLYAFWTAQQYTITYTCGSAPSGASTSFSTTGGYGYTASNNTNTTSTVSMDGTYTLASTKGSCVLPGYTFKGWSCDHLPAPTSQGGVIETGVYKGGATGTYSYAGNITCNAVWKADTIILVSNNGFGGSDQSAGTCEYDGAITLPTQPSRPGYQFNGWTVTNTPPTK